MDSVDDIVINDLLTFYFVIILKGNVLQISSSLEVIFIFYFHLVQCALFYLVSDVLVT